MALRSSIPGLGRIDTTSKRGIEVVKGFFFRAEYERLLKATEAARYRELSRCGAYIRTTAMRSMRIKKGASGAGKPPNAHPSAASIAKKKAKKTKITDAYLREMLYFGYDPKTKTVVVGPFGFKKSPVPHLHEFGGSLSVRERRVPFGNGGFRTVPGGIKDYPPRPYMRPALAKELPKFAHLFRGSISV